MDEAGVGDGGGLSSLLDVLVCTHQSLNLCSQVRKACVLCDKLTSGTESTHRERTWRRRARRLEEEEEEEEALKSGRANGRFLWFH